MHYFAVFSAFLHSIYHSKVWKAGGTKAWGLNLSNERKQGTEELFSVRNVK